MKNSDVPAHLAPVVFNVYRGVPEANGDHVSYGDFTPGRRNADPQWYRVEYATGSGYSGGVVTLSNYRQIKLMLETYSPAGEGAPIWCSAYGGYATYALFVAYWELPEEIRAVLCSLEDYPVVDDNALSELELELGDQAWESWGRTDLRRALEKEMGAEELEQLTADQLFTLFRFACSAAGHDWIFEEGSNAYFDFTKGAKSIARALANPPSYLDEDQIAAFEALRLPPKPPIA